MECFGEFQNDRICEICSKVDLDCYNQCVEYTLDEDRNRIEIEKQKQYIRSNCPYRRLDFDDYHPFYGCFKNGVEKDQPDCIPKDECLKHIKQE